MRHTKRMLTNALLAIAIMLAIPAAGTAGEERVRVAVLAFDTYLVESNWEFAWDPSRLSPLASSMLTKELTRHQRFDVIERSYIDAIMREQDFGQGGRVDSETAARIGHLLGAQVIVVGEVEHFGASTNSGGTSMWKLGAKIGIRQRKVKVALGARFVDASTGKVLGVADGQANVKSTGVNALYKGNALDSSSQFEEEASKVLRAAIEQLGQNLATQAANVVPTPMLMCAEGRVAMVSGSKVYLNLGADSPVDRGHYFEIRDPAKPIPDPEDPNKVLGYVEESIGMLRIVEVQENMSVAEIVHGDGFAPKQLARISGGPEHPDLQCRRQGRTGAAVASSSTGGAGESGDASLTDVPIAEAPGSVTRGNRPGTGADPNSSDISTAGAVPRTTDDSPVGEWRLDVNETTRFWIRSFMAQFAGMAGGKKALREHEDDEDVEEWREALRELHMRVSIRADGTFYLEMKDPADHGLTTVEGSWEREGLYVSLQSAKVDGIPHEETSRELLKPVQHRMYGQPYWKRQGQQQQPGMVPWLAGTWALQWPAISGAVFARDEIAQR